MSERRPPLPQTPRILVGICTARQHAERRQAIRDTWLSMPAEGVECRFFAGGGDPLPDEPDVIPLDVADGYDDLPAKVLAFFRHALDTYDFEWLFKCDDDTYVCIERLLELPDGIHDFFGDELLQSRGSPQGGAGYLISRNRVQSLLSADLPSTGPEDILIGETAIRQGAKWISTERLCWGHFRVPRRENRQITSHYCSPDRLRAIHTAFLGTDYREYLVDHAGWTDRLRLHVDGFLNRVGGTCCGRWREQDGLLRLGWFDWAEEEVRATNNGGYSGDHMTLRPVIPFVNTVRRTRGFLCSAAFAYPRMEVPFIAEWADYHLSLGVEHIFLGINLADEYQPLESLLPAKRPFPSLYILDRSEGDVMADFVDRLRPFRDRLTYRLHRRSGHGIHSHCTEQVAHYNRVLGLHRQDYEWVAVHDIDEFLVPVLHDCLPDVLRSQHDDVCAVQMRQVVCEARWNERREPRQEPVLSLQRRLREPVPLPHGHKTITRMASARALDIHDSAVYGRVACEDSILNYHYRGFPSVTEIDSGYRLPVEREEFDAVDSRPAALLLQAKRKLAQNAGAISLP